MPTEWHKKKLKMILKNHHQQADCQGFAPNPESVCAVGGACSFNNNQVFPGVRDAHDLADMLFINIDSTASCHFKPVVGKVILRYEPPAQLISHLSIGKC